MIERRRKLRKNLRGIGVSLIDSAGSINARGRDISANGMQLEIGNPQIQIGDTQGLSFDIIGRDGSRCEIKITGIVKWISPNNAGSGVFAGISFCDLENESRKLISHLIAADQISDLKREELDARNTEIRQHADNALKITLGMITATITGLGANLMNIRYMYLIPLLIIQMGFELYKLELKQIRRIGAYIRCFLEEEIRDLKWETLLYRFRGLSHSVQPYNDRDKFFTLGYYYIALWLSIISLVLEFVNISFIPDRQSNKFYLLVYAVVCFYWFFYRGSKLREENKEFEGGEEVEKEMFSIWQRVKEFEDGICRSKEHFEDMLAVLWQKGIARDFDKTYIDANGSHSRILTVSENKNCYHRERCSTFTVFKKIADQIKNGVHVRLGVNLFFLIKWIAVFSLCVDLIIRLYALSPSVMPYLESRFSPFIWFLSYYWLVPLLVLIIWLNSAKVRIKRRYWASKRYRNGGRVVSMDEVIEELSPEEKELFPWDYTHPQEVSLLEWIFYYGLDKTWVRQRGIWCVSIFGNDFFQKKGAGSFIGDRWYTRKNIKN